MPGRSSVKLKAGAVGEVIASGDISTAFLLADEYPLILDLSLGMRGLECTREGLSSPGG